MRATLARNGLVNDRGQELMNGVSPKPHNLKCIAQEICLYPQSNGLTAWQRNKTINPFVLNGSFLYLLKKTENLTVF